MKKLVFSLAVLFSVAMVSCGGNKTTDAAADSDTMVVVEETVEVVADSNDTTVAAEAAVEAVEAPAADSAK